jgi:aromatic ring hydroxylase
MEDVNLGVWLGLPLGLGSLFLIIRLYWTFTSTVTAGYQNELRARDQRIEKLETDLADTRTELDTLRRTWVAEAATYERLHHETRREMLACATERAALRQTLRQHHIPWNPEDWNMHE